MTPRYLYKSYKFIFNPNDLDIMRWAKKIDPHRDFAKDAHTGGHLSHLKPPARSGVSSALGSAAPSRRSTFDGERLRGPVVTICQPNRHVDRPPVDASRI
jgi:hypothetical protein